MTVIYWFIALLFMFSTLAYLRKPLLLSSIVVALTLLLINSVFHPSLGFQIFSWLLFLGIAIPLNTEVIRRNYISAPLFALFKKIMPTLSKTEQEALEAGTVWWDGELFTGNPDWDKLIHFPTPHLTQEEKDLLTVPRGPYVS